MAKTQDILNRYDKAKTIRAESLGTFEEIGRYVWPASRDMVETVNTPEGEVKTVNIYDSTAIMAAQRMASGLFSFLMPVGVQWFQFVAQEADDKEDSNIETWLSIASQGVQSEIWRSNFQRQMFTTMRSMTVFGTGVISVEMDKLTKSIIFKSYHYGDIFYEENSKGDIDVVFRRIRYTVRQAVLEYGINNVSVKTKKQFENNELNVKVEFVHAVFPNDDRKPDKLDSKKFDSVHIEVDAKKQVKKSGFNENPYLIGRLDQAPNEIIGRCPSFDLLPEIKMANSMKLAFIEGAETASNPPLIVWDDSVIGQPVTGPRGIINVRPDAQEPKPLNTGFNPALNDVMLEKQQAIIKKGYFTDLFDALEDQRNMTATEADIRQQSKLVILAPMVNALQTELFDPLLSRVLNLMVEERQKPAIQEPPKDFDFDVVYQGRLAVAMATLQANAIETHLAKWAPYEELFPVNDNIDIDAAYRRTALNSGVPGDILRTPEERDEIRNDRTQKQEAAQQAEIAATAAKAYKDASVPVQAGSVLEQLA